MSNAIFPLDLPRNEPVRAYAPGSAEKVSLKKRLAAMLSEEIEIPLVIGGREVRTGHLGELRCPHDHHHLLGRFHQAGPAEVKAAAAAAKEAWHDWSETPWEARAAVLLKAADLLAGPWRDTVNAATMLNQSKTVYQAEIDSACELIDFWRFNPTFMRRIYEDQPISAPGVWNRVEYRPLEGFVFAASPFNFTAIGGNLPTAPALMGNTVLWKPASTAVLSNYYIYKILEEAGLPPGVINFLPGNPGPISQTVFCHEDLAGVHFTGSTPVFQGMYKDVGENIAGYKTYPRLVGETGGKNFVFAHASADVPALVTALLRGAFEYQGQKCSASARAYIPRSLWDEVTERLVAEVKEIRQGATTDFRNFMAAVIDKKAFDRITGYLDHANDSESCRVLAGGKGDESEGYFIQPTVVAVDDPADKLMTEEIFGPILSVHPYDDGDLHGALARCESGSPYALTGSIFARDRGVIEHLARHLRHAAGNFYINDKSTGAVVGQQPFGGARASGTNDKAGSMLNLLRWTSQRSIKEAFVPATDFRYPHLGEE
jgi:1-pyrroline-5-carboxylate dehydrogenase